MTTKDPEIDWAAFLRRPPVTVDAALSESAVRDRRVLITGAGGSIGAGLAAAVLQGSPESLVLLDSSEHALFECYRKRSADGIEVTPVVGSVMDSRLLEYLFGRYQPELVLHAAAYKHVPLMEQNPLSAIVNNAVGTYRLVAAAAGSGVGHLLMVSTDKVVNPQSIMGASKRIAELVLLSHATERVRMNGVRLGNVLGSSGSVVPIFREQVAIGLPMTVTHPESERYFLTPEEAEVAILQAASSSVWGRILVPDCGNAFSIVDLAQFIAASSSAQSMPIEFIGLRPGDKLREELWSSEERVESLLGGGMRVVVNPPPSADDVAAVIRRLDALTYQSDLTELSELVRCLVPTYAAVEAR